MSDVLPTLGKMTSHALETNREIAMKALFHEPHDQRRVTKLLKTGDPMNVWIMWGEGMFRWKGHRTQRMAANFAKNIKELQEQRGGGMLLEAEAKLATDSLQQQCHTSN